MIKYIQSLSMQNIFKKGLLLGGLLAVAAALGFAASKEGQQLTEELQKDLKMLAKNLEKHLTKLEDVTKESFYALIDTMVDEYAKKKDMANDTKEALIGALQAKWHEMEKEYLAAR